uniref:RipA family octameric membrane protein n=1 Tax=Treponema endosymbiont of Eucomonympha sp. TaxID=1580831 RepID=UPI000AE91EF5
MEYENKRITDDEYLKPYEEYTRKDECKSACKKRAALQNAFATRKFEIGLYWKRTAYFWFFISAIFVAYYHVVTNAKLYTQKETFPLLLAALGVFVLNLTICVLVLVCQDCYFALYVIQHYQRI